jgi:CRP-like cAMP-binding protein
MEEYIIYNIILYMPKATCNLCDCFLCQHCISEWRPLVGLHKETRNFKKGKVIFLEGDPVEGIYFMYHGWVKIHKKWTHPRELIIRFAGAGEIMGHRGLGDKKTYPVSATALEDCTVCFVQEDFLEASLKANPTLTYRFLQFYSAELQKAEQRMRDLVHMETRGRIAGALLEMSNKFGTNREGFISMPVSRQDIASYAGTTYETLFKLFNDFKREKIITTSGKFIKIKNEKKLNQQLTMQ